MIYRQTSVYKFLDYCNQSNLEKKVVDCGAGGNMPPLGMFYSEGYETVGIEMDNNQISLAGSFEKKHNMKLNIIKGDMRYIPFKNEVLHSYFEETEGDKYFEGMDIIYKESRVFHRIYEGKTIKQGAIDYIVKKR